MSRWALLLAALPALAVADVPRTLAVSYFDVNATDPELGVLKKGLADMLISDLSVVKGLQLVEREKLNQALAELALAKNPFVDPASAVKLGKGLSATHMLTGSLTALKGKLRISARVFDVQTGAVLLGKDVEGDTGDFFALEKELVELLVSALSLSPDVKEKAALRRSQTESLPAFKSWARGLDQLDRGDKDAAQESFLAAKEADPRWQRVQSAIDALKSELGKVETRRAGTLAEQLARLSNDDPQLDKKLRALARPDDLPYGERDLVELQVLEFVATHGLAPWKPRHPGGRIGESTRSHWEAETLLQLVGAFGAQPQGLRAVPVVLLYLASKYADDPTLLDRMRRDFERFDPQLEKVDWRSPPPAFVGAGEYVERQRAHCDFLQRLAAAVPLPRGASREPMAAWKLLDVALVKEKARRRQEFEDEFERRVKALDPRDPQLDDALSALFVALQEEDDRLDATKKKVRLSMWLIDRPEARPMSGTEKQPHWVEAYDLLQWMTRYDDDPALWEAIPGAGEYLLKKYPEAAFVPSQLKLHLAGIESQRRDGVERARKRWEEQRRIHDELKASDEVKAMFLRAGQAAKRWKAP